MYPKSVLSFPNCNELTGREFFKKMVCKHGATDKRPAVYAVSGKFLAGDYEKLPIWCTKMTRWVVARGLQAASFRATIVKHFNALSYAVVDSVFVQSVLREQQFCVTMGDEPVRNPHANDANFVL